MSAPNHTPGPWFQKRDGVVADRATGKVIATLGYNVAVGCTEDEANAARIVACVNACEGVANGDLHAGGVVVAQRELIRRGELMAKAADDLDAFRAQRDSLAAALRACVDNYYNCEGDEQSCARAGREALAKLDGKP